MKVNNHIYIVKLIAKHLKLHLTMFLQKMSLLQLNISNIKIRSFHAIQMIVQIKKILIIVKANHA